MILEKWEYDFYTEWLLEMESKTYGSDFVRGINDGQIKMLKFILNCCEVQK